ncbi:MULTISPECIES: flagellar basal body L-ring protein FlgH [unclassified Sphingobium]|uniref:flagellar basal body L-ring protein FlgH n=1 Tax=unclassified Sphingobium TaxID=2611147 RepID=UPI0022258110|nr:MULTISPECIES: flagellar basal body L-ring protein FlgH [unclassified Sphingobium]MCW2381536.1 flagellar L-ring protein precursor FlgH [Sphingobium sp. B2D3B]MCW2398357.1 flagellar L-ring protein precursor FlgH [Sphingobium sp. B2D3C]
MTMQYRRASVLILAITATGFAAPASAGLFGKKQEPLENPAYQVTYPGDAGSAAPVRPNGGIFQASAGYSALTNGARAASVGDVITILLVERTQASKSTSANTNRAGSIGLTPPSTGPFSKLFSGSDIASGGTQGFTGKGDAAQSNALSGEITVTIARVYPNGTMLVRGQKALTLNRGDEYVQISGLVRQADIGPDNRILSTRVADARITYTGKGEIARASRQGWLQRFFSMISPF